MAHKEKTGPKEIELIPESPWMFKLADWFQDHGQKLIYGSIGVIALLILAFVWTHMRQGASEKAYVGAEIAFNKFFRLASEQSDPANEQPFTTLKDAIESHPELGARYDAPITQVFLRVGAMDPALVYGDRALKRLSQENFPYFEEFSKVSLLIVQGDHQEALKRSVFLQKKLEETEPRDALTLINQIRLAMLYGQLGNQADEIKAWDHWEQLITKNPEAAQQITDGFKTGKVTLSDYIAARKKELGYKEVTRK